MRETLSIGTNVRGVGHAVGLRRTMQRMLNTVRTIIGAPDYDRYVQHMQDHHPNCQVASRDEFMQQRLESRYSRPGSRCC